MNTNLLDNKDFWSGVMLIAIGAGAIYVARDYALGTALRMGPGYFPTALGALIALAGLYFLIKSFRDPERIEGAWSLRALIVLPLSFVAFGLLMERAGFIAALVALVFGSAAASPQFRFGEVALLTLVLTLACVAIFIWGIGLPYRLLPAL
jgi:uncharacterized membrane protein